MPGPADSTNILKDVMNRPNAAFKKRADMGQTTGISFAMESAGARKISGGDPNNYDPSVTHRDPEPAWDPNK